MSSSIFKDLVAAQNCGVPNNATGFTNNLQQINQQVSDAKQYDMNNNSTFNPINHGNSMHDMLNQAPLQMRQDVDGYLKSFNQQHNKQHMHNVQAQMYRQQQHQHQHQHQPQQQYNHDMMAAEFERMQLQMRQQNHNNDHLIREFEAAYRQQQPIQHSNNQTNWMNEFEQKHRQQQPIVHNQQHRQQQHNTAPIQYQQQHQQYPYHHQPYQMPQYSNYNMYQSYIPQSMQQQQPLQYQNLTNQQPYQQPTTTESELKDIYGTSKPIEVKQNNDISITNEQTNTTAEQTSNENTIGGLDRESLDKLIASDDPKWRNSKFIKFINKISKGEIEFRDNQAIDKNPLNDGSMDNSTKMWEETFDLKTKEGNWDDEYLYNTQGPIQDNNNMIYNDDQINASEWAQQFNEQQDSVNQAFNNDTQQQADELDWDDATVDQWAKEYSQHIADEWKMKNMMDEFSQQSKNAYNNLQYDNTINQDPEYVFPDDQQQKQQPIVPNSYEEGIRLFSAGYLNDAIRMFEQTVQQQPDHADAWCYLGQAQAENENEHNAISALLKCISIDPYNLTALMMLGVSYTNDLEEHRALNYLKTWLLNNPDYQHPSIQQYKNSITQYEQFYGGDSQHQQGPIVDVTLHDEVTRMFNAALQLNKNDSDLHTVLGVLYHITGDFDKAIDSFKHAINIKPNDSQLWNKLGATQANSARSNDAVHAYRKALELRPSYVRAHANLAIAYANQGMHHDAVQQYLTTLKLNPNADHIWSYLRISLGHLGKDDLVQLTQNKDVNAFKPYYTF